MIIKAKVLVVGGGPAGATAASVLAKNGMEIILLEENLVFRKPCGGGISSIAFEEFQIDTGLIQRRIHTVKLVSPNEKTVTIDLAPDFLCIVDRTLFDTSLRKRAAHHGAEILEGKFLSVEKRKRRLYSTVLKGNEKSEIESEYVIAADGINSNVRKSLGLHPPPAVFTVSETIENTTVDQCEFWFSASHAPQFYSWVFPGENRVSVGTGSFRARSLKQNMIMFKQRRMLHHQGKYRIYRLPIWKGDLYNKGNIIFAGDSAGQVMPLSYEGIYYAMKSGRFAAEAVMEEKTGCYKKIWKSNLHNTFSLMSRLNAYFLKNDRNAEKLVSLHNRAGIQEAAKALWLLKDEKSETLRSYKKLLGKILI